MDELKYFNGSHKRLTFLCKKLLKKLFIFTGFLSNCDYNRASLLLLMSKLCTSKTNIFISLKFFSLINFNSLKFSDNFALKVINKWDSSLRFISRLFAYYHHQLWLTVLPLFVKDVINITFFIKRQIRYEAYRIISVDAIYLDKSKSKYLINMVIVQSMCDVILASLCFDLKQCKDERYIKYVNLFTVLKF